jgi:hypothetical protein
MKFLTHPALRAGWVRDARQGLDIAAALAKLGDRL